MDAVPDESNQAVSEMHARKMERYRTGLKEQCLTWERTFQFMGCMQPGPQDGSLPKGYLPPGDSQKLRTAQKTLPTADTGLVTRRALATRRDFSKAA